MTHKNKALWAINPFIDTQANLRHLKELAEGTLKNFQIEPAFVVSPVETGVLLASDSLKSSRLKAIASQILNASLASGPKIANRLLPSKVLFEKDFKISESARKLAQHAASSGFDLIVVETRGQTQLSSFGIGSFARSLLHASKIPLLTLNPRSKKFRRMDRVVFATDLSQESEKVFAQFCKFAKSAQAKQIDLLFVLPRPASWTLGAMGALSATQPGLSPFDASSYLAETRDDANKRSAAFSKTAGRMRIATSLHIVETNESVAEAIERFAVKRKAGLVGLVATTGRFWGSLLGSTTYKLIGQSVIPVWVARPY
jgi:nucleotide-binding universal stress UspA family protein